MFKKLTLSAFALAVLLCICACSLMPTETASPAPSQSEQPTPTPEVNEKSDLTLSDFDIIYPSDEFAGTESKNAALNLRMEIINKLSIKNGMYGDEVVLENENPYEILIGNTNRAESLGVVEDKNLRYYDWAIKYVGTKLVINGGSDSAIAEAVNYAVNNLLDEKLTTIEGFKKITQIDYTHLYESNIGKFMINGTPISAFKIVSMWDENSLNELIDDILTATGEKLSEGSDSEQTEFEILIGECDRAEYKQVESSLGECDYAIELVNNKLVIAARNDYTLNKAVNKFRSNYLDIDCDELNLNKDNDIHYVDKYDDLIITVDGINLRDPCVLLHDGVYYMYGTWWQCYKNTTGNLQSGWEKVPNVVVFPEDACNDYWAPEVHEYKGKFYMFTTYRSSITDRKGCAVFCADTPEGPFELISDGHVTPTSDRHCIDGTLYVDEDGQPWMVFVVDLLSTGMDSMACAKMSDDLTHLISETIDLFDADAPAWATFDITDGPWLYRCENGELLMIWSNFSKDGYAVGIAHSTTGLVTGPWVHEEETLFPVGLHTERDGGHGMIFTDINGNMWLSIHSPNSSGNETPTFIPVREENGTIIFDDNER